MSESSPPLSRPGLEPADDLPDTPLPDSMLTPLARLLESSRRVLALTGAGCSTESGIPDYRDSGGGWKRSRPVQFGDFLRSEHVRKRYWARSLVGWSRVRAACPNAAHKALGLMERHGPLHRLVTQNVDGLHQRAGSLAVTDLHGRLDMVVCTACGVRLDRDMFQTRMRALNPDWLEPDGVLAPDGDADLDGVDYGRFRVPDCHCCGGLLKPDVVFFGENVPRERVGRVFEYLDASDLLLVCGSSLMVWSGYRFVRHAAARGIPVAIVNLGRTRGDGDAALKLEARCGDVLPRLAQRLMP